MKVAVLFSGGKDSCFACYKAMEEHKVMCLISIISENKESYMFHTPNIALTDMQAKAMELNLEVFETLGEKEIELKDLKKAIQVAKEQFTIEGVVTGAIRSEYQKSRIQKICDELELKCINPMWHMDELEFLNQVIDVGFKVIIVGVAAEPFDESWLGREIDKETIKELVELNKKYKIHVAGEGGEIETFVCDGPIFKKKILIKKASKTYKNYSGVYHIEEAELAAK